MLNVVYVVVVDSDLCVVLDVFLICYVGVVEWSDVFLYVCVNIWIGMIDGDFIGGECFFFNFEIVVRCFGDIV